MTAQAHEKLILDGTPTSMAFCPPLPENHPRVAAVSDRKARRSNPEVFSTACWRGYVGTWEIRDSKFYLIDLVGRFRLVGAEPLLADWFSGVLRIPRGEMLQYVHMGFGSVFEEELHIQIENGIVLQTRVISNRDAKQDESALGWQNLPGHENRFPGDDEPFAPARRARDSERAAAESDWIPAPPPAQFRGRQRPRVHIDLRRVRFCGRCGRKAAMIRWPLFDYRCSECGHPTSLPRKWGSTVLSCATCHHTIGFDSRFCPLCGAPVEVEAAFGERDFRSQAQPTSDPTPTKQISLAAIAQVLNTMDTLPNRRSHPQDGDLEGDYDEWFDGGAVRQVTGYTVYAFQNGVRVRWHVRPNLSVSIEFPDGERVVVEQGSRPSARS